MRFRPRPVSMFWFGSGVSVPIGSWLNCMNTRFQYSRKRSFSPPGRSSGEPNSTPRSQVELRARSARPRRPRLPEVLRARAQHDPVARDADGLPGGDRLLVGPEAELLVALEHGDPDVAGLEPETVQRELPRLLDGALLEVVAQGEVAEHLEERQVARGVADVLDVGRAEALLTGRQAVARRALLAEEVRLERVHARRREQDRRVVRLPGRAMPMRAAGGRAARRRRGRSPGSHRSLEPVMPVEDTDRGFRRERAPRPRARSGSCPPPSRGTAPRRPRGAARPPSTASAGHAARPALTVTPRSGSTCERGDGERAGARRRAAPPGRPRRA